MGAGSIRVGRLAGIPIGIHSLWLLIVALITWSLGAVYYPDEVDRIAPGFSHALGFVSALLLFASILRTSSGSDRSRVPGSPLVGQSGAIVLTERGGEGSLAHRGGTGRPAPGLLSEARSPSPCTASGSLI